MNDTDPKVKPLHASEGTPDLFRPYTLEDARRDAAAAGEGLPTGFKALDQEDLRWKPGKLYVVAGRPGEGKTTLLLEMLMRHVEERSKYLDLPDTFLGIDDDVWAKTKEKAAQALEKGPAVFVSYEDNRFNLYVRLLLRTCAGPTPDDPQAELDQAPPKVVAEEWLRTGTVSDAAPAERWAYDLERAAEELDSYSRNGLLVLLDGDQDGGDVDRLLENLRAAQNARGEPPSLLVVDYYQKIRPPADLRGASRYEQLQEVADLLRRYAKGEQEGQERPEYAVPVLVGAQVNRDVTAGKESVQPELHHIREADDLANDATAVLTLHRPGADKDGQPLKVKVVKNRDGRRDRIVELGFYGSCCHVADEPEAAAPATWD